MKRIFDAEGSSDGINRSAKIPNRESGSDTVSSFREEDRRAENADSSQTALATSFAQQKSVLSEAQIEILKGFDKEGVSTVLYKITRDACNGHPGALNAISPELVKFDKEELKAIFQSSPNTLNGIVFAACKGHPAALNSISSELAKFDRDELKAIFQASPHTLTNIAWAAGNGHPDALNAISGQLEKFSEGELKEIFQASPHTLNNIAFAACQGHPDALNAISGQLAKFNEDELKVIFQNSPHTLDEILGAACEGHPDALSAVFSLLDGITGLDSPGVVDYITYLNDFMRGHLTSLKTKSRFLGLERAFCNLDEIIFSRITNGVTPEIISQLQKSITWYKEFTVIFNQSSSDQADRSGTEFQIQENLSARVRRFINDNVLQRDRDQTSRESRVNFVKGLCDYLTMMSYHHFVLDLNKIYLTYQSGLNGFNTPGYADSVLGELHRNLACPSGIYFFQASPASPESDLVRDKRYKNAYGMLKSFNANLGLWIQFKPGRDPLSAQDTVVEHFKLFLRSYLNVLGDGGIDDGLDYEQVNEALIENNWVSFKSIIKDFMIETAMDEADSSLVTFSFGS